MVIVGRDLDEIQADDAAASRQPSINSSTS